MGFHHRSRFSLGDLYVPQHILLVHRLGLGIGNLLSSMVLVTVVIMTIGFAVTALVIGIFSVLFGIREDLLIYPNATLRYETGTWVLSFTVLNRGSVGSVIVEIKIDGVSCKIGEISIDPGSSKNIQCFFQGALAPYPHYDVKIYTRAGNMFLTRVLAIEKP